MDAITSLRQNFSFTHDMVVEGTMEGITDQQLHWLPAGTAHNIASTYAHLVLSEDMVVNGMIAGKPPLAATTWAGKIGLSEMPPQGSEGPADWSAWAKTVKVDLPKLREYAKAVYASTDAYLSSLKPEDLDREIDGFAGKMSINMMLQIIAGNSNNHIGEIATVKGLQGLKGYPF